MPKSKTKNLPRLKSLDDLVEFFDTHDLGDYWEEMPEALFEVELKKRIHLFALDEEIAGKLSEIAKAKHISSETLIDSWLREKIQQKN